MCEFIHIQIQKAIRFTIFGGVTCNLHRYYVFICFLSVSMTEIILFVCLHLIYLCECRVFHFTCNGYKSRMFANVQNIKTWKHKNKHSTRKTNKKQKNQNNINYWTNKLHQNHFGSQTSFNHRWYEMWGTGIKLEIHQ